MSTQAVASFENVNLNEIDPAGMKMPVGTPFNFRIASADLRQYSNDKGSGEYTLFKFTVIDDPKFTGRTFYKSLFADKSDAKKPYTAIQLRKLMDCTGVPQEGGYTEWLADLVTNAATFSAPLEDRKQKDGTMRAEPNLFQTAPAN